MIQILNKEDCCGCLACVQIYPKNCIDLKEDNEGFLYPLVDAAKCIQCSLCEKVCPVINQGDERKPIEVLAAKNKNEKIRLESSSGGIFTLMAEEILNRKGVVFGARFDSEWGVIHSYTDSSEGLAAFRGSKYLQSYIGNSFKEAKFFLEEGREVLFSGTPCQIDGLKKYLRKDYVNLHTVDFVCHGVPSPKVWKIYLAKISKNKVDTVKRINFRSKNKGWKLFSLDIEFQEDGNMISETLNNNPFIKIFLRDYILRPSCYKCPSKCLKGGSDVTIADYWGIDAIYPQFDDDKGVSLVMINSEKGKSIIRPDLVSFIESNYDDAFKGNPSIEKSVRIPKNRDVFWTYLSHNRDIIKLIRQITKTSFKKQIIKFLRKVKRKLYR